MYTGDVYSVSGCKKTAKQMEQIFVLQIAACVLCISALDTQVDRLRYLAVFLFKLAKYFLGLIQILHIWQFFFNFAKYFLPREMNRYSRQIDIFGSGLLKFAKVLRFFVNSIDSILY